MVAKLEAQLALKNQEIEYFKKKINHYENNFIEAQTYSDKKIRAVEREYEASFQEYKRVFDDKYHTILCGLSQLLPLVETLERCSLHGRHFTPSETNMSILMKAKEITIQLMNEIQNQKQSESFTLMVGKIFFDMIDY